MHWKKYVGLSICAIVGMSVNTYAAEVYNNTTNGDSLDIYGEVNIDSGNTKLNSAGEDHSRIVLKDNSSRVGFRGKKSINSDFNAVFRLEWGLNTLESEANNGDMFNNRLGYAGIQSDKYGTALIGKQWSVYYDVAGWTDVYEGTGAEVLNVYEGASGGFTGRGRADDAITYRNTFFKDLTVGVQAQGYAENNPADNLALGGGELNRNAGIGTSAVYALSNTLNIGASYYFTDLQASDALTAGTDYSSSDYNQGAAIVGIQYSGDKIDVALNLSQGSNTIRFGETSMGIESYLAYKYQDDGSHIYVGSNTMISNVSDDTNNDINYVAIGFLHSLIADTSFYLYGEYRYDLRSDEEKSMSQDSSALVGSYIAEDMSQYRLGVKYTF